MTAREAAGEGAHELLKDQRAGEAAKRELGVLAWQAYDVNDTTGGRYGLAVYGTDVQGQVRLAYVLAATKAQYDAGEVAAAIVPYDLKGPIAPEQVSAAQRMTPERMDLVREEMQAVVAALRKSDHRSRSAQPSSVHIAARGAAALHCSVGVGAALLAASLGGGIVVAAPTAAALGEALVAWVATTTAAVMVGQMVAFPEGGTDAQRAMVATPTDSIRGWVRLTKLMVVDGSVDLVKATASACKTALVGESDE